MNPLRAAWRDGRPTFGVWLSIPDPVVAEALAGLGYDFAVVDLQHGLIGDSEWIPMLQAVRSSGIVPLVRVPWAEPGIVGRVLDAGARGVIAPMVNDAATAQALVRACRYAPDGDRSYGPFRASLVHGPGYATEANDDVLVIPMVETTQAVAAVDEIAAVAGVDVLFVGPSDLSLTMGLPPRPDQDDDGFRSALAAVVEACGRHEVTPGIYGTAALGARRAAEGFRLISVTNDLGALLGGAGAELARVRTESSAG